MKVNRKVIVYIAASVDGCIARPDGDVEWLNRRPDDVDYGMKEFYASIDTILWGLKTYDWLLNYYRVVGVPVSEGSTRGPGGRAWRAVDQWARSWRPFGERA